MEPLENDPRHDRMASFSSKNKVHAVVTEPCHTRFLNHVGSRVDMCCGHMTADGVDKCARILFPTCFLFFNICYWSIYSQPNVFVNTQHDL